MPSLQIKNVPEPLHEELRRRAAQLGVSVRDYVLELIRRDQALPSRQDWLERLAKRSPIRLPKPAAEYLAEVRESRGDDAGRR